MHSKLLGESLYEFPRESVNTETFRKSPVDRFSRKGRLYSLLVFLKFPFSLFSFFIEVWLIYNVVLISAVQQSDSVIHIYIHSFLYSFPLWFITGY